MLKPSKIKYWLEISAKLKTKPLIISAGMMRSGSTLLFNILHEILKLKYSDKISYGWKDEILKLPKGNVYLLKMHTLNRYYRHRAKKSFYTYRDIRVAAISAMKKFEITPSIKWFDQSINQYLIAKKYCDKIIRYEDLISEPINIIREISETLGIFTDPEDIVKKTYNLQPPEKIGETYSRETLLHKGHFTNTKNDEWRSLLPEKLKEDVNREFSWWFEECGYPRS
jgi:hypothetical protein